MSRARDLAGIFNLNPLSGTTAQRPTTAEIGDIFYNGTTGKQQIYTTTGWKDIESGIPYGNDAGRPSSPIIGQPYFNGQAGRLEIYTSTGWNNIVQETPAVTSISGNYIASNQSNTLTIYGTNFVSGASVYAVGSNNIEVQASSVTFNSLVQLTATFTGLTSQYEPYSVKVVNPSMLFGLLPGAIYVNETPLWNTASGSLGTFVEGTSVSTSVSATDPDGTSLTYSVTSGSLPSGLSLASNTGVISGTPSSVSSTTTSNFTITASDGVNTSSRAFNITISSSLTFEYLVVGGGGGGGGSEGNTAGDSGGGGGAGAFRTSSSYVLASGTYNVSVGGGGAGGYGDNGGPNGSNGEDSIFATITSIGGGGGGTADRKGLDGGSGGGSAGDYGSAAGLAINTLYGNNGAGSQSGRGGGGGGGAGAAGSGRNGGAGLQSSITGTATFYAGGGAANANNGGSGGSGGSGIGGSPGSLNGVANTGSGGCSSYSTGTSGGSGGSGVVIIAYPSTKPNLTISAGLTYDQPTRSGYKVYRFTSGTGTISF